jgi:hypothetical protein
MNLFPFVVIWAVLFVATIVLFFYRRSIARYEDDTLHVLDSDQQQVAEQVKIAQKLEAVEKWGKIVTVVMIVYGLILLGVYGYLRFEESSRIPIS